jgi:hypothetical protein
VVDDSYLENVRARLRAATPGPWISFDEKRDQTSGSSFIQTGSDDLYISGGSLADQDFIAASRQDVEMLLDEIMRLRAIQSNQ